MNTSVSNTFCILPWLHLYANPNGDVLPCCLASKSLGNLHNDSIVKIWNSTEYQKLRERMLNGEKSEHCKDCYILEEKGIKSKRQGDLEAFKDFIGGAVSVQPELDIKFLDIRWSNICNFKCKTCSGDYSSKWATAERRKNIFMFAGGKDNHQLYEDIKPHLTNLKVINFGGGEPLLIDQHYEILEYLIEHNSTNTRLIYNTNFSKLSYKNKNVVDLWNKFKHVSVFASIDSWGDRAEYIREGTDWKSIEENFQLIKTQCPHVQLKMNVTVSIFNLYTLTDLIDYILEKDFLSGDPIFYNLINPGHYSSEIIEDKTLLLEVLNSKKYPVAIQKELNKVIRYVSQTKFNKKLLEKFKSKQPEDIVSIFPELKFLYTNS
jgi:radical SAM protein with 4Fe4S-binding SPASM domain